MTPTPTICYPRTTGQHVRDRSTALKAAGVPNRWTPAALQPAVLPVRQRRLWSPGADSVTGIGGSDYEANLATIRALNLAEAGEPIDENGTPPTKSKRHSGGPDRG